MARPHSHNNVTLKLPQTAPDIFEFENKDHNVKSTDDVANNFEFLYSETLSKEGIFGFKWIFLQNVAHSIVAYAFFLSG